MEHDRAGLEEFDRVVSVGGHLPERLPGAVGVIAVDGRVDQLDPVVQARLLERPAHANVLDVALGEVRDPAESGDRDCHGCSSKAARYEPSM